MKSAAVLILVVAGFFLAAPFAGAASGDVAPNPGDVVSSKACQIQAIRSDMALLTVPIRSQRDLARHLRDARETDSPLDFLSPRAKRLFLSSLTFGASGLSGYRYDDLARELTVSQAYQVLALFGAQDDVRLLPHLRVRTKLDEELRWYAKSDDECSGGNRKDHQCEGPRYCGNMMRDICKANC